MTQITQDITSQKSQRVFSLIKETEKDSKNFSNPQKKRTRCEVWTRVMGYHRPVANFNVGKKSEHYSRKHFSETASANSQFCKKYTA